LEKEIVKQTTTLLKDRKDAEERTRREQRSEEERKNRLEVRLKRTSELMRGLISKFPDDALKIPDYFDSTQRLFTLFK